MIIKNNLKLIQIQNYLYLFKRMMRYQFKNKLFLFKLLNKKRVFIMKNQIKFSQKIMKTKNCKKF